MFIGFLIVFLLNINDWFSLVNFVSFNDSDDSVFKFVAKIFYNYNFFFFFLCSSDFEKNITSDGPKVIKKNRKDII